MITLEQSDKSWLIVLILTNPINRIMPNPVSYLQISSHWQQTDNFFILACQNCTVKYFLTEAGGCHWPDVEGIHRNVLNSGFRWATRSDLCSLKPDCWFARCIFLFWISKPGRFKYSHPVVPHSMVIGGLFLSLQTKIFVLLRGQILKPLKLKARLSVCSGPKSTELL